LRKSPIVSSNMPVNANYAKRKYSYKQEFYPSTFFSVRELTMTVEDPDVVDFINVDRMSGGYLLSISDHLPWDEEEEHLFLLQEKINTYIAFVESGQLASNFPGSVGKRIVINIGFKYPPPQLATRFIEAVRATLIGVGLELETELPFAN
jgi:hypothetical protein